MGLHLIIHSCLTPGENGWDEATTVANGYWVIFSIPGGIKPKGTWPIEKTLCNFVSCKMERMFKFSLKCTDYNIMNMLRFNVLTLSVCLFLTERSWLEVKKNHPRR